MGVPNDILIDYRDYVSHNSGKLIGMAYFHLASEFYLRMERRFIFHDLIVSLQCILVTISEYIILLYHLYEYRR
jgi:hypothetical protein